MSKYYVMTRDLMGNLYFYKDRMLCYASEEWEDAKEGILTEPEVLETWRGDKGQVCAMARGKMVETDEFDWNQEDMFDITEIVAFTNFAVVSLRGKRLHGYWVKIHGEGLQQVEMNFKQREHRDVKQTGEVYERLRQRLKAEYEVKSEEETMAAIIRNFKETTMESADCVDVLENTIFQVSYPGWYRDWCQDFVIDRDGNMKKWVFTALRDKLSGKKTYSLKKIIQEMERLGISAGADSGDAVEGVSAEERKYLTTYRLTGGGLLVMFKAETFHYDLLKNTNLTGRVTRGLGNWLYRYGEPNQYWGLMD